VTSSPARTDKRLSPPWWDFALLVATGAVALRPLALFWSSHPDYAFGWGVPFLAGYLFFERWSDRPDRQPPAYSGLAVFLILIAWGAALLACRLLEEVVPDWRPGLWVAASLYAAAVLGWCGLYGGRAWLRHFWFPVAFLLLGVPWLYNLEFPVVQGLMRLNADLVADSLLLADIPAEASGNTLQLATGQLGIEEACSGIRSLQAVLMLSLFLGEFYRFPLKARLLLPVLAMLLALAGNYARLLFLAWRGAQGGISSVEEIHDSAGLGVLVFTVFGLWIGCLVLKKGGTVDAAGKFPGVSAAPFFEKRKRLARRWVMGLLIFSLGCEGVTQGWFAWRENSAPPLTSWSFQWPGDLQDFRALALSPASRALLRYDQARTGSWRDGRNWRWQALWFEYGPQAANRIAFDLHNPEACLAAAGLQESQNYGEFTWSKRGLSLPVHAYLFTSGVAGDYVFWIAHLDCGQGDEPQIIYGRSPDAFLGRLFFWSRDAWRGFRGARAQTLEVAISGPADYSEARRAFLAFANAALGTDSL
jgi:exosortase